MAGWKISHRRKIKPKWCFQCDYIWDACGANVIVDLGSAVCRLVWTFRGIRRLDSIRLDRVSANRGWDIFLKDSIWALD